MTKTIIIVLLFATLSFSNNDSFNNLKCFTDTDFLFKQATYSAVDAKIFFRSFNQLECELYTDTIYSLSKIIIEDLNGYYLWSNILDKCIGSVEIWSCKLPYFLSKEMSKYAIFFDFENKEIRARLTV